MVGSTTTGLGERSSILPGMLFSRLPLGEAAGLLPDRHRQGSGDRIAESIHDCRVVVVLVQSGQCRPDVDDEDLSWCRGHCCDVLTVAAAGVGCGPGRHLGGVAHEEMVGKLSASACRPEIR